MRKSIIGLAAARLTDRRNVVAIAVSTGPVEIPLPDTVRAILTTISGESSTSVTATQQAVIEKVRMPRAIMALSVGAALAIAGTIMQAIFRNPLADPGIIGTSGGGALGAVIVIALGIERYATLLIPAASVTRFDSWPFSPYLLSPS